MQSIAIIGANSFLSQALIRKLKGKYYIIQVFNTNKTCLDTTLKCLSIEDFLIDRPLVDVIYFIASFINFDEELANLNKVFKTNVFLLKEILEAYKFTKIIHASSVSVYNVSVSVKDEQSSVNPKSSYAMSKLWAELLVKNHSGGGVNIRISSLFGEGMNTSTFVPSIIRNAILKQQINLFGNGSRYQNYIHVEDAATIFYKALDYDLSSILLAVNRRSYSNIEIANFIKFELKKTKIIFEGDDNSDNYFYNNDKTIEYLDISFGNDIKQQINNLIKWLKKQY